MDGSQVPFLQPDAWAGKIYTSGWATGAGGTTEVTAPADGSHVAVIGQATAADLKAAAATARAAQPSWEATPAQTRADILNKTADILEANAEELRGSCARRLMRRSKIITSR